MLDFLLISTRSQKRGTIEIVPKFIIKKSSDLMIRGGDFYAIWDEEKKLWSTDEQDVVRLVDAQLDEFAKSNCSHLEGDVRVLHMWDAASGMIDIWHKYCQRQMRDSYHMLDERLIFANTETKKTDYASKKLPYPLEFGTTSAWEQLMSTLYQPAERHKIEWAIGSIVSGDSRKLQKFMVLYGAAGTGKSTVLNIIQQLFDGYLSVFDAKALGSSSNAFALEAFKSNPLVAIQHDGDLSRIEDNTRLNSLVSHEKMTVNEKFKSTYTNDFKAFLFMGTNKPVKITDAKSGLIRRLIDVTPSGNKLPRDEYQTIMAQIPFELGSIAARCKEIYEKNPGAYDDYIPINMMGASNDFYNFVMDSWLIFKKEDETTLKTAWEMYKVYCEDAKVLYPENKRVFKEELKNYFKEYYERIVMTDGSRIRNYYKGFKYDKFEEAETQNVVDIEKPAVTYIPDWLSLRQQHSILDDICADCKAQYASEDEKPLLKWDSVATTLKDIDSKKLHYILFGKEFLNLIIIDFDIRDASGKKSFEENAKAASKWPKTYAETSKSGAGIHLHYFYSGDVTKLSRIYDDQIEVKVMVGNSSLRRMLTVCNDIPIATISSGLPLKEEKDVVDKKTISNEKNLRILLKRTMNKEFLPGTKPSVDFIVKILDDAYASGMQYNVSDMYTAVLAFASRSTNHADYCLKQIGKMKFQSKDDDETTELANAKPPDEVIDERLIFFDVEVFPNLVLVCWKVQGEGKSVVRWFNPTPTDISKLVEHRLVGFNNRNYDNHIIYAIMMGYTPEQIYNLSQRIINGKTSVERRNALFGSAYDLSYTDIYDFASAGNKKSLKKLEIEMGINHQELGLPWDEPVDKEKWEMVGNYCENDVIATEAAFEHLSADWIARVILSDLAGMKVNDTTNSLTTKIIFSGDRSPQHEFQYRNLAEPVMELDDDMEQFLKNAAPVMMSEPHGEANSLLPYFDGYSFEQGVSTFMGEKVGEGGWAKGEPGMHINVALLDITSMHPHSIIAECLFGVRYTQRFKELVDARVEIKHENWDKVRTMLDGKLTPYIKWVKDGRITAKDLANALKTAINSVYGLTSAKFQNAFRDTRNIDNIVAKRGSLFMVRLKDEVMKRGFTVCHVKTDSVKIPNATPEIIKFIMEFGKRYGYNFEHEATYEKMCLVNHSVYVAKYASSEWCEKTYGYIPDDNRKHSGEWTATGEQFKVPYVFKTLFSKEPIVFDDMCEVKSVTSALYLDRREGLAEDEHCYQFIGKTGQFTPVLPGHCGGELKRITKDKNGNKKFDNASDCSGYLWEESEKLRGTDGESYVDKSYYNRLVDDAVDTLQKNGCDVEWFVS